MLSNKNKRLIKRLKKQADKIADLENGLENLTNQELMEQSISLKQSVLRGDIALDNATNIAFALVREASKRTIGKRHFDSQIIGGLALSRGGIAEMRTGEGKTLVATLPAYINFIADKKVHVVTVNDYLAGRDASIVEPIFRALGVSVGVIQSQTSPENRKIAYQRDITYGTSTEFGFDYLRDNMCLSPDMIVQSKHDFCIIDEVDSILIDEARTPLLISGAATENPDDYIIARDIASELSVTKSKDSEGEEPIIPGCDAILIEKLKKVQLTEAGYQKCEDLLIDAGIIEKQNDLYSDKGLSWVHLIISSLNAQHAYEKNTDYIVRENKIMIIDPNTGRVMNGRRWGDGLHQSIEAKEQVTIEAESITLGSISIQNYFKLYKKMSGMTGTAKTEEMEFAETYNMEVIEIPPHKPNARIDERDQLFLSEHAKISAIIQDIERCHANHQPVLVGTTSVGKSEQLSDALSKIGIVHEILNAKYHDKEAHIISQAGRPGAVTIATNMAGRGTDIILGGNIEEIIQPDMTKEEFELALSKWELEHARVIESGGLRVIGTERHDSRRIDNQLRGRSGRQGDPGSTVFYLSLEDRLMRVFGGERFKNLFSRMGLEDGDAIEHRLVDKAIHDAQRKIESMGYDNRKELVKYDNVLDHQRRIIYKLRRSWLLESNNFEIAQSMLRNSVSALSERYIPKSSFEEQWNLQGLTDELKTNWSTNIDVEKLNSSLSSTDDDSLRNLVADEFMHSLNRAIPPVRPEIIFSTIKSIAIRSLDTHWQLLIEQLQYLKEGIHLRSYASKTPIQEYQVEAKSLFESLLKNIQDDFSRQFVYSMHSLAKAFEEHAA